MSTYIWLIVKLNLARVFKRGYNNSFNKQGSYMSHNWAFLCRHLIPTRKRISEADLGDKQNSCAVKFLGTSSTSVTRSHQNMVRCHVPRPRNVVPIPRTHAYFCPPKIGLSTCLDSQLFLFISYITSHRHVYRCTISTTFRLQLSNASSRTTFCVPRSSV